MQDAVAVGAFRRGFELAIMDTERDYIRKLRRGHSPWRTQQ